MIDVSPSPRRKRDETVPMINVAFLLLIFFLMTAVIAPPDALGVEPPLAEGEGASDRAVLSVAADGSLAFGEVRGEAVFAALPKESLALRADASLPGAELAALLERLANAGVDRVDLVTVAP